MKNQIKLILLVAVLLLSIVNVSAIYYVNIPTSAGAPGYWVCDNVYQNCEFGVVHDCLCGTINCDGVNTCESVKSGYTSDTGLVGPAGYSFFLTNGYCQSGFTYNSAGGQSNNCVAPPTCTSWTYSYGTCSATCGGGTQSLNVTASFPSGCTGGTPQTSQSCNTQACPVIIPPTVTAISPINNYIYNTTSIILNVASSQVITTWLYNLNNAGTNTSFVPGNTYTLPLLNDTNTIKFYGTNVNGTGIATVNFIYNSTSNQTPVNNTNSTLPSINVTSPKNGFTYNTTSILLNATSNQIVNWFYNLNGTNAPFNPGNPYILPLVNGSNTIIIYANNSNGTNSQTITFTYNATSNNNGVCVQNWVANSWSSCHNNKKTRSYFDSNSCNNNTGKPSDDKKTCSSTNDEPTLIDSSTPLNVVASLDNNTGYSNYTIYLGPKKVNTSGFNIFLYWLIIIVLLLLILIILVYIFKFA